jgi:hypothetical protein
MQVKMDSQEMFQGPPSTVLTSKITLAQLKTYPDIRLRNIKHKILSKTKPNVKLKKKAKKKIKQISMKINEEKME